MYGLFAIAEYGDFVFYSHPTENGLYRIDKRTNKVNLVANFEQEPYDMPGLHGRAVYNNRHIIFFPMNGKNIALYNIDTERIEYFVYDNREININKMNNLALLSYVDTIWFFSDDDKGKVFQINIKDKSVKVDTQLCEVFYREGLQSANLRGIKCINNENRMFYTSGADNKILSYDLLSNDYKVYCIDEDVLSALIAQDSYGRIWYVKRGRNGIGFLDSFSGEYTTYGTYPSEFECPEEYQPFLSVYFIADSAVFIPARANSIIVVDIKTGVSRILGKVCDIIRGFDFEKEYFPFSYSYETDDSIIALFFRRKGAVTIRKKDFSINVIDCMDGLKEAYRENARMRLRASGNVAESEEFTLCDFLNNMEDRS